MIKLVIFDLDGTLMDAYPAIVESFNYVMKTLGYPVISPMTIKRKVGFGARNLLGGFVKPADLEKALRVYGRNHWKAITSGTKLMPGAAKVLKTLEGRGYRLAVASNRSSGSSNRALRHLKVRQKFDYVLCGDKLKHPKPHPEVLLRILRKFKLKSHEALYVGDMTIDVQTGQRAGVRVAAVTTGSSTAAEIKKMRPFKVIRRLDALLGLLKQD